jgi:small subunit ribosomal protein S11
MGKKHIIQKTEEEMIKEGEQLQKALNKEPKVSKSVAVKEGKVYIFSSYNNTIVTLTDTVGNVLASKSAGTTWVYKVSKKSTPLPLLKLQRH